MVQATRLLRLMGREGDIIRLALVRLEKQCKAGAVPALHQEATKVADEIADILTKLGE